MKCHGNKNEENNKHNPMKHMLMMILCCGLPLMIMGVISLISIDGGLRTTIASIIPYLCPLMMILMIPMMIRGMRNGSCCNGKKEIDKE